MLSMTPFLIAVTLGASQSVKVLLDHGAEMTATDSSLNSCLHLAVNYRKAEMVKMLLERDKNEVFPLKDQHLKTALHLAAGLEDSKVSVFQYLYSGHFVLVLSTCVQLVFDLDIDQHNYGLE